MKMKKQYSKNLEKKWRNFWEKNKVYRFDEKSKKPIYSVDTPPPYVSAEHLHTGHIMSYTQAEFVVRFKRMQGFNVYYPMGFDDNGLPTERFVEKKYNIDKSKISRKEFIKKCLKETQNGIKNYKHLWNLLGISVDWSKTYSTINPHCRKISQWSFIDLYKKNKIERRKDPIYWCPVCQTALAQADLEDKKEKSYLNYIKFEFNNGEPAIIATTRPELIPACVALFVNPSDKRYKKYIGKKAKVPLFNYMVPVMSSLTVDKELGTGLMMVCTWGDVEDIKKWHEYKLETRQILEKDGTLNKLVGSRYQGLKLGNARGKILEDLKNQELLLKREKISHVLNVHERCDTPAEFIVTKQWFISLLKNKKDFIQKGNKLNWFPKFMKKRYIDWVKGLKWDWCISRQRYYGVPFPVWYCKDCNEIILPNEKDLPVDPSEEKPKIKKCLKCGGNDFIGEKDVMDTWMTSSVTPIIASKLVKSKKLYPMTLRPQAFEIIRTWLFYTIVKSHYHYNNIPFKDVMISGHGQDENGRKISKRLGNYINPELIIEEYGADAIRYWATGAKLGMDMKYSEKEVKKGKRTVIKLWNASRLTISHLKGFKKNKNFKPKNPVDIWILNELQKTIQKTTEYFEAYEYSKAKKEIEEFFWNNFSDNYLELVKHRLYGKTDNGAKNTLYVCLLSILKLYAPIMPFITEEIYQNFKEDISIHKSSWPKVNKSFINKKIEPEADVLIKLISLIRKTKSEKGISLAKPVKKVIVNSKKDISKFEKDIKETGKIEELEFKKGSGLKIKVEF